MDRAVFSLLLAVAVQSSHGLECGSCSNATDVTECYRRTVCNDGEVCVMEVIYDERDDTFPIYRQYTAKCSSDCPRSQHSSSGHNQNGGNKHHNGRDSLRMLIGNSHSGHHSFHRHNNWCALCCTGDMCNVNRHDCDTHPSAEGTRIAPSTPTKATSPTTSITTKTGTRIPDTSQKNNTITCLACHAALSLSDCTETEPCHFTQFCRLSVIRRNDQLVIEGGCVPEYGCENDMLLLSDEEGDKVCGECCKYDNCNKDLCPGYLSTTSPTTSTTTPVTTTTTTTTTTTPTTPSTTTNMPTTITTTIPTTAASINPVDCEVCDGGMCGIIPGNDPIQKCPVAAPYCMNVVNNEATGRKSYTKKCASTKECQKKWWEESSDEAKCTKFNPVTPYSFKFTCSYCCVTSRCNKDIFPAKATLFKGVN